MHLQLSSKLLQAAKPVVRCPFLTAAAAAGRVVVLIKKYIIAAVAAAAAASVYLSLCLSTRLSFRPFPLFLHPSVRPSVCPFALPFKC